MTRTLTRRETALAVLLLALAARVAVLAALKPEPRYVHELGVIAQSLADGHGFRSPFAGGADRASIHFPPVAPALLGLGHRLLGAPAAQALAVHLNALWGALTAVLLLLLGERWLPRRSALAGALLFALACPVSFSTLAFVWPTAPACLAGVLWLHAVDRLRTRPGARAALVAGCATGLLGLLDTTLLPLAPAAVLAGRRAAGLAWRRCLGDASLALAACLLVLAPWLARNAIVTGGAFVPIRGNLGLELWVGNGPDDGRSRHPFTSADEAAVVRALGEHRYNAWCRRRALDWIRAHPAEYGRRALQRWADYWAGPFHLDRPRVYFAAGGVDAGKLAMQGLPALAALLGLALALRRRSPAGAAAAWAFLLVPLPYVLTQAVDSRYRHALDPLVFLLAGHAACRAVAFAARLVPETAEAAAPAVALRPSR